MKPKSLSRSPFGKSELAWLSSAPCSSVPTKPLFMISDTACTALPRRYRPVFFIYGDSEETRTDQEAEISVPRRSDGDDDYELYTVTCILTPDEYDHILENRVAVGDCYYVNWYLWEGALFSGLNCRYAERRIWQKARH